MQHIPNPHGDDMQIISNKDLPDQQPGIDDSFSDSPIEKQQQQHQQQHQQQTTTAAPGRRTIMRTSLHFMASDEAFRMQIVKEDDWREKLRLVKERASKLDGSRRGQEQQMEVHLEDMDSQVELEISRMRQVCRVSITVDALMEVCQ
jgi:hypothetical protein